MVKDDMTEARANQGEPRAGNQTDVIRQRFAVEFEYPVHFTHDLFAGHNPLLEQVLSRRLGNDVPKVQVFIDRGVARSWPQLRSTIRRWFAGRSDRFDMVSLPRLVAGGETAKEGWKHVAAAMRTLGRLHLDRHALVIGIGGGAMLDMLGLAVSLVHRGLRLIRVPTTTLAQCDAAVGVKNGIDAHGMKNFAGTFAPPFAVIADFEFLKTLAQRDWIGGVAEAFKVAMIKDARFFGFLCRHAAALAARDAAIMHRTIRWCAGIHLDHIRWGGDPFETGSARPLDFGHWAAHQIECLSGYRVGHGQATAIGMAIDSHYAMQCGLLSETDYESLIKALTACGLPVWDPCLEACDEAGRRRVLAGVDRFREHLGGDLTVTLPRGIGARREVHALDMGRIENAIAALGERSSTY